LREAGLKVRATSLDGRASETLLAHAEESQPWLLAVGRFGIDALESEPALGNVTERLVRTAGVNLLVAGSAMRPETLRTAVTAAA
jgi:nucleotide-binding universal stress UspA family protein